MEKVNELVENGTEKEM